VSRPDIDAIRAREAAATEGPWKWRDDYKNDKSVYLRTESPDCFLNSGHWSSKAPWVSRDRDLKNANFIVHAREDIPALLAYVEEMEELLCPRCKRRPKEPGTCPYDKEINDTVTECDCCSECRQECAWDI